HAADQHRTGLPADPGARAAPGAGRRPGQGVGPLIELASEATTALTDRVSARAVGVCRRGAFGWRGGRGARRPAARRWPETGRTPAPPPPDPPEPAPPHRPGCRTPPDPAANRCWWDPTRPAAQRWPGPGRTPAPPPPDPPEPAPRHRPGCRTP